MNTNTKTPTMDTTKTTSTDLFVSELTRNLKAVAMTEFLNGNSAGHAAMRAAARLIGQFYSEWIRGNGRVLGNELLTGQVVEAFDRADRDTAQLAGSGVLEPRTAHTTLCLVANALAHLDPELGRALVPAASKAAIGAAPQTATGNHPDLADAEPGGGVTNTTTNNTQVEFDVALS